MFKINKALFHILPGLLIVILSINSCQKGNSQTTPKKMASWPFILLIITFTSYLICGCKSSKRNNLFDKDIGWESIDSKLKTKYQPKAAIYVTIFNESQEVVSIYRPHRLTFSKNARVKIVVIEDSLNTISIAKGQDMPVIHRFENIDNNTISILLSDFMCPDKYVSSLASLALRIHTEKGEYFLLELDAKNYDKRFICD